MALLLAALAVPLGAAAVGLVHEVWGGVVRGTEDAASREIWKGLVGGAFFAFGALEGTLAAVRSAAAGRRRWVHRLGMTLAFLNVAAVVALVAIVGDETARHSRTLGPAPLAPSVPRGVSEAWARLQRRIREEGATLPVVAQEYAHADRASVLGAERNAFHLGIGPVLLALGDDRSTYSVTAIDRTPDPRRVVVTASLRGTDGQHGLPLRFPMVLEEGEWRFAVGHVDVRR